MADEAGNINTAAEDPDEEQQQHEHEASSVAALEERGDSSGPETAEQPAAAENSWSGPFLSLARKATETISSGMSYAAAPRKLSHGSAASSPLEKESENELSSTSDKPAGKLRFYSDLFILRDTFLQVFNSETVTSPCI